MNTSKAFQSAAIVIGSGLGFAVYETLTGHEKFYKKVLMPTVQRFYTPEDAHKLGVKLLSYGIAPLSRFDDASLKCNLWGKEFTSPIGMAAGFDKHAEAMHGLSKLGFGFVEVGSVTPYPQDGNPQPRVFRLPEDKAVINRYGFNSCGHEVAKGRLQSYRKKHVDQPLIVGVNLGKNRESQLPNEDYALGVKNLGPYADYIVINVSSPNTPGLRNLQNKRDLTELCKAVLNERKNLNSSPPILVKVSPDLNENDISDIAEVAMDLKIDGLIVSNTTISRSKDLQNDTKTETGGLSGSPVKEMSSNLVKQFYQMTQGSIPIIGVGGIENGVDAYEKIKNGASLVQIYTSFTYHGPPIVNSIKRELSQLLKKDGFDSIHEAVGVNNPIQNICKEQAA